MVRVDLAADFAYRDTSSPNSISGTLWEDTDLDGNLDGAETNRFEGVTVVLKDINGNVVATTTTDSSGNYSFTGLPDGTYTVDVTDDDNLLNGYWHTLGDQAVGSDGTSKADPYSVSVAGGQNINTVDFGYYIEPAAIGNFIWKDIDKDGIQDGGEPGIAGVVVILTIEYPNGTTITVQTVTDSNGYYEFGNLLLDESYDGVGVAGTGGTEPKFTVSVDLTSVPSGYGVTALNAGSGSNDSRDPAGADTPVTRGAANMVENMDFGFDPVPTSVTVIDFKARYMTSRLVRVGWTTVDKTNVISFNIYRSTLADGSDKVKVNQAEIPVDEFVDDYFFFDRTVTGVQYYYWLAEILAPNSTETLMDELGSAIALPLQFFHLPLVGAK